MAKDYDFEFIGQASFYSEKERSVKMYFTEPEIGVNEETGILLIIAGYGGNSNSNVYKKMRNQFADEYNLVTVQCDYFGWEFMQGPKKQVLNQKAYQEVMDKEVYESFLAKAKEGTADIFYQKLGINLIENLDESLDNYNDQGIIQAFDNLVALKILLDILDSNSLIYNKKKVIVSGHSHGAYIAYLCNMFEPKVFSMLIDNSSYVYPNYLNNDRLLKSFNGFQYEIVFKYLVRSLSYDSENYNLDLMYAKFENQANIISFHGINDNFLSLQEKKEFLDKVSYTVLEVIDENRVNDIFKSCNHGLDADFIKFFDYVWNQYPQQLSKKEDLMFIEHEIKTSTNCYLVDMSLGVPRILKDKN